MKKLLLTLGLLVAFGAMNAQNYDRSIGLRLGTSIGASYKEYLNKDRAVEGILDLDIFERDMMKLNVTGIYQFVYNTEAEGLNLYYGPGASVGVYLGDTNGLMLAINGMAGIEYKFPDSPVSISLDWNPRVQIITNAGFKPANFGLTLRYQF
jgi:hypothetical protein